MSAEATLTIAVAVIALVVQTIGLIAAGIWKMSRMESAIRAEISEHRIENDDKINVAVRSVGETFTALRQKITEVELYVRDTFLQKESFRTVVAQIMSDMKGMGDRIESRLLRMEGKMDRQAERSTDRHDGHALRDD